MQVLSASEMPPMMITTPPYNGDAFEPTITARREYRLVARLTDLTALRVSANACGPAQRPINRPTPHVRSTSRVASLQTPAA